MTQLTIIGAGAWGTALAAVAQRAGSRATLWARDPAIADAINTRHENPVYLPDISLDPAIRATADVGAALVSGASVPMRVRRASGATETLMLLSRVDTRREAEWLRHGGILPYVLEELGAE